MFRASYHLQLICSRPTLLAACLAFSLQAQAQIQAEQITFALPAQPLAASLSQVAQQAKIQLLFDEELLRNVKAPALKGNFSPEAAIQQLLGAASSAWSRSTRPTWCAPRKTAAPAVRRCSWAP